FFHPPRRHDAEAEDVAAHLVAPRQEWFMPFPHQLWSLHGSAAEGSGEVDDVVTDPGDAIDGRQDVVRVYGARAAVIEPGGKDVQAAKITAVLVGHGVVG